MSKSAITGCIIGTAVGDALGLPYEGVSRKRLPRLLGAPDRHRRFFGRGMVSDDTEHTCMVAQSLIASGDDVNEFTRQFARRLRWWFLALPAGIGKATLRASVKLWFGVRPTSSGVFSAGNGPAMRAAIFGACFDNEDKIVRYVQASSRITHTDPKAEYGAIAVALAARMARQNERFAIGINSVSVRQLLESADDPTADPVPVVRLLEKLRMRPGKASRLECCNVLCELTIPVEETGTAESEAESLRVEPRLVTLGDHQVTVVAKSLNQALTITTRRLEPERRGPSATYRCRQSMSRLPGPRDDFSVVGVIEDEVLQQSVHRRT